MKVFQANWGLPRLAIGLFCLNMQDIDLFICCENEDEGIDLLRKTLGCSPPFG